VRLLTCSSGENDGKSDHGPKVGELAYNEDAEGRDRDAHRVQVDLKYIKYSNLSIKHSN